MQVLIEHVVKLHANITAILKSYQLHTMISIKEAGIERLYHLHVKVIPFKPAWSDFSDFFFKLFFEIYIKKSHIFLITCEKFYS